MQPSPELCSIFVNSLDDLPILFLDPKGVVTAANPAALRFAEAGGHALVVGQPAGGLYDASEHSTPPFELVTAESEGRCSAVRSVRQGHRVLQFQEVTLALRDEQGGLCGFSKTYRDVTDSHQTAEELAKAHEEMHQFAFTVSHDLQEPLRTARSYAELLQRRYKGKFDTDGEEFLAFLVDATARMAQLLKDLLAYSQAGRADRTRLEKVSPETALQWTIMNLSREIEEKNAKVTFRAPLPLVMADGAQLASVFQHLIGNSIKFHQAGSPEIQVEARGEGGMCEFSVRDNGPGIQPQFHDRVFGVFKRLVGKDVPGTGIGLSICKKIVEAHGGRIWILAGENGGTEIRFTIPEGI